MKVLVTGGAGFIGAHVAAALQARGDEVILLDNFNDYYDPRLKRARVQQLLQPGTRVCELDLTDAEHTAACFSEVRPDAVIHLAAWAGVRPSRRFPSLYTAANVVGTANVFDGCAKSGVRRVIFASSSSVYGPTAPVPSPEDAATTGVPPSVYGVSKRTGELYAELFHHLEGLQVTCLRFFTVYGSWYRPDMGIFRFTEQIVRGEPVRLFVRSADGREVRRGFTDVGDSVRGVLAALNRDLPFAIVNMGSSDSVPLRRVIAALESTLGKKAIIDEQTLPAEEEIQTAADLTRAHALLGYAPATRIEDGIENFVRWYRDDYQRLFPDGIRPSQYWG
ncbi:MAG: NAD-dependent epimerase/dehydratase family protein [bacterium]|nr:NAD-dependent epimerase/dehydratase family protein [bacterium]